MYYLTIFSLYQSAHCCLQSNNLLPMVNILPQNRNAYSVVDCCLHYNVCICVQITIPECAEECMLVEMDPEKDYQRRSHRQAYDEDEEGPGVNRVQCASSQNVSNFIPINSTFNITTTFYFIVNVIIFSLILKVFHELLRRSFVMRVLVKSVNYPIVLARNHLRNIYVRIFV